VPPLRERKEDIPLLADYYLQNFSRKYGKKGLMFAPVLLKKLESYNWPGNVRELQHAIEKAMILSEEKLIKDPALFIPERRRSQELEEPVTLEDMEKVMIDRSIQKNKGNLSKVAAELGITRATLYRKMEKFGIS
jgi:transcriptional regulator with PAS, ATPase and Fis domain